MTTLLSQARFLYLVLLACLAPAASAQTFALDWHTVDSGGTLSAAGGEFSLQATIAQIDGLSPEFGGTLELRPGFWGGHPPCVADLTGDTAVDLADFFAFFQCFDTGSPCADLDGSGAVDLVDFFAFFTAFDQPC